MKLAVMDGPLYAHSNGLVFVSRPTKVHVLLLDQVSVCVCGCVGSCIELHMCVGGWASVCLLRKSAGARAGGLTCMGREVLWHGMKSGGHGGAVRGSARLEFSPLLAQRVCNNGPLTW